MGHNDCHVAIVGGGIAGLYAAYRLRQAWQSGNKARKVLGKKLNLKPDEKLKVILLEENPLELGGRLRNVELPFPHGSVIAEVGAMRFTTRQILLRRLLHDLNIKTMPFEGHGFSTSYYLRGKHFGESEIKSNSSPYNLANTSTRSERGKGPGELVSLALDVALKELSLDEKATPETLLALEKLRSKEREKLTYAEWKEIHEHGLLEGKIYLRDIGIWNLIHHTLSPEGAKFVEDGFGYESVIGNWNLSDAVPWFIADFSPGQSYETVEGGFAQLVETLKNLISHQEESSAQFECEIVFNTRVRKLEKTRSRPPYRLSATKTSMRYQHQNDAFELKPRGDGMLWREIHAAAVILALPKKPLENLNIDDLFKDKKERRAQKRTFEANVEQVRPHRLAKLVQAYRKAWWQTAESPRGAGARVITDLPLRQLYYWDREWLALRGRYRFYDEKGRHVIGDAGRQPEIEGIVVAYLDGHYASYWRFITAVQRLHDKMSSYHEDEEPGSTGLNFHADGAAKKEMQKCESFGERIWGWSDPPTPDVPSRRWSDFEHKCDRLADLYSAAVEDWSDETWARYLYLLKHGLFERASTKMTSILKQLHSSREASSRVAVEEPVAGAYTFWDDFGDEPIPEAGWHTWEPGVNSEDAMEYMVQPFKAGSDRERIFICGEAYSSEQGWIEGALKSVERLMDRLGLDLSNEIRHHVGLPQEHTPQE